MISIVIPSLYPTSSLESYVSALAKYPKVSEVIVVVNAKGITPSPRHACTEQGRNGGELPQGSNSHPSLNKHPVHWRFWGKNTGFTGACNAGAKLATGKYILFLNDDCEITEDNLNILVNFLEAHSEIVATQPVVYRQVPNSPAKPRRDPSIPSPCCGEGGRDDDASVGVSTLQENDTRMVENIGFWVDTQIGKAYPVQNTDKVPSTKLSTKHLAPSTKLPIYGLSGTCLLICKAIFDKIGMFDEAFHSYLEDVDLAIRLHQAGYVIAPCLEAEVVHQHMATSSRMGLYKQIQDVKNWWRLIIKHRNVFVHIDNIVPLFVERLRNVSGLVKASVPSSTAEGN